MKNVRKYILTQLESKQLSQQDAVMMLKELQGVSENISDIAIIGMSCKLPMAKDKDEFWDNLINARNCFTAKPEEKLKFERVFKNDYYAELFELSEYKETAEILENIVGAFIEDIDKFDAGFFNIPPREAKCIDPAQRVFLETAWGAVEDAGYSVNNFRDTKTGVYVGKDYSNSIYYKFITEPDAMKLTGTWEGILASRISYIFNLKGPAMVIDTACSSGLIAIHEACAALRNKECEMAIAGGLSVGAGGANTNDIDNEEEVKDIGALGAVTSNDNRVRTFDNKCSGSVFGEGVVAFLLKPLSTAIRDKDNIYGIIKGSAINNDGASNGITAPNPVAQEEVIIDAWKKAKVAPETIDYIEAHGTGTLLGDPIEILGLSNAFKKYTNRKQFCGIGSVKTNIGHLVAASGCASLAKVALSLQNKKIPASLYFEEPNAHINFCDSPVYVLDKAIEWKEKDTPRRAGINAFGFSGTNCHLIVEEYKSPESKRSFDINKKNIITFSAKTETSMVQMIKNYKRFLEIKDDINIHDACFTANTGRGHYGFRVVMLVNDFDDLRNKIKLLEEHGLETMEDYMIFYGKNKIISDKKKTKGEGEITENELRTITIKGQDILNNISNMEAEHYNQSLLSLCELYIQGASIDWNKFYSNEDVRRVSLPTYPFDRVECWGIPKVTKIQHQEATADSKFKHPLVERCLVESMSQNIYSVHFALKKHWMLREHKIMGSNIVPGTTYIEMCREICSKYYNSPFVMIKELTFLSPLVVVGEEEVETHIILTKDKKNVNFNVVSKHGAGEDVTWTVHAEGVLCVHEGQPASKIDFAYEMARADKEEIVIPIPEDETSELAYMGPRWHCVEHIYKTEQAVVSEMKLKDEYLEDLKEYSYHPSLADAALNIPIQIFFNSEMYLPLAYKDLKIYRPITERFYSYVEKVGGDKNAEVLTFKVVLSDLDGNIIAEIDEYTTKKVSRFNNYVANAYYNISWIEQAGQGVTGEVEGAVLIFKDKAGLAEQLADKIKSPNNQLYFVAYGEQYEKVDESHYIVGNKEEDYFQLLEDMKLKSISKIYHLGTVDFTSKELTLDEYPNALNQGVYSFLFLTRALVIKKIEGDIDFVLVSSYAHEVTGKEDIIKPTNAAFLALGKTIVQEYSNLKIRCIDIDEATEFKQLYDELFNAEYSFRVALRENKRLIESLGMVDVSIEQQEEIKIHKDGVYIITGGMGGIGTEMARYLMIKGQCNICLIGRRAMPSREQWEAILSKNEDKKLCNLIRAILEIEENGSHVVTYSANVCDKESMKTVITDLKDKFGKINGIIHAAGVAGDGFLLYKKLEVFQEVINPKIIGTRVLDELTADQKLDFLVLFSSMQTVFGGAGQGDYTVGNAFLDAYAPYRKRLNKATTTINWPGWSETGMAVDYNVSNDMTLFTSLKTRRGLIALDTILNAHMSNVIPGELSYEFLAKVAEGLPIVLSNKIKRDLERYMKNNGVTGNEHVREFNAEDLLVVGKEAGEYTETERNVAAIYAAVLNLSEIDVYESFNAMGGDSIIATEVLKILNTNYNNMLNVSDMFTYSCIIDMAEYIDTRLGKGKESIAVEEKYENLMDKFELGEVDVDIMIDYFNE